MTENTGITEKITVRQVGADEAETLLAADVGVAATTRIVERLRTQSMVLATASGAELRELLIDNLVAVLGPDLDRTLGTARHDGLPGVVLVVVHHDDEKAEEDLDELEHDGRDAQRRDPHPRPLHRQRAGGHFHRQIL